jgi:hypothetical protein
MNPLLLSASSRTLETLVVFPPKKQRVPAKPETTIAQITEPVKPKAPEASPEAKA